MEREADALTVFGSADAVGASAAASCYSDLGGDLDHAGCGAGGGSHAKPLMGAAAGEDRFVSSHILHTMDRKRNWVRLGLGIGTVGSTLLTFHAVKSAFRSIVHKDIVCDGESSY